MVGSAPLPRARTTKHRAAAIGALVIAFAALPAWAGDTIPAPQSPAPEPVFNDPLHRDASSPAHRLKFEVPHAFGSEQSAQAPKLSIELGYGGAQPLDPTAKLPDGPWGHTDVRAIKAGISLGF